MSPTPLKHLKPASYQHPREGQSLEALTKTKGIGKVVRKFHELGIEKAIRLQYTGGSMLACHQHFEHIIYLVELASHVLNLEQIPDVYIQRSEEFEALTLGVENPIIVVSSECIDQLSNQELLFILGREIAHIQSNHTLYQEIGIIFPELMDAFSGITLGFSGLISTGMRYALFYWAQTSEYTADRGGLLACQDEEAAKLVLAKQAGLPRKYWSTFNISVFEEQARAFEGYDQVAYQKIIRYILGKQSWAIDRAKELIKWIDDKDYATLLVDEAPKLQS
jgi:Zn-dependent protease with chaperone function